MTRYLTKVWVGRRWWYLDTRFKCRLRYLHLFGKTVGVISHKKDEDSFL